MAANESNWRMLHFTSPGHAPVDPTYNPELSEKKPVDKGTYDGQVSHGTKWKWIERTQEWEDQFPPQVGRNIDHGYLDIDGPKNGNWK